MTGCLVMAAACGAAVPHPAPSRLVPSPVLSNYERSSGNMVRRDCGYSSPLPGKPAWSIWLFCDTMITGSRGRKIERLILGTDTAADGGTGRAGHPHG